MTLALRAFVICAALLVIMLAWWVNVIGTVLAWVLSGLVVAFLLPLWLIFFRGDGDSPD